MYIFGNGTLIVSVRSGAPARRALWRAERAESRVHTTVLTSQILNLDKLTQGGAVYIRLAVPGTCGLVPGLDRTRPRTVLDTT